MKIKLLSLRTLPAIFFSFCLLIVSCTSTDPGENLKVEEFDKRIKTSIAPQILDVRTKEEFEQGHLKNAVNVNWNGNDFESATAELNPEKEVYVYCLSGGRSSRAAENLRRRNFKKVYEMDGGILAWNKAKKAIEKGASSNRGMSLDDFKQKITADHLILVDFGASWCEPCVKISPMLEQLKTEYADSSFSLLKINADEHPDLLAQLQIAGLPTLFLYNKGRMLWHHEGLIEKKELKEVINENH